MKKKKKKTRQSTKDKTWTLEDFVDSVETTMEKQADEHPYLHQVHARLSPEWKMAAGLVQKLIDAENDEAATLVTEMLVSKGDIATRVLIDFVQTMTQNPKKS